MLTKRSPEQNPPKEEKTAETFGGDTLLSDKAPAQEQQAPDQKAESAKQENRRKELALDLRQEADTESSAATSDPEEVGAVFPHERVADIRNRHGDYIMHFVPEARLQVAKEELGEDASVIARTVFALKRKFSMLPETDLQRLDHREADLVQHLVDEEQQAFLEARRYQEEGEQNDKSEQENEVEEVAETTPEPADARRIAAPDIRSALTRGEHDAEQEQHNQQAA